MSDVGCELFVISDLHIGGKYSGKPGDRGFRINTHVDALVRFIEEIGARARVTGCRTELVINGDFIDFLAEEVPTDGHRRSFISSQDEAVATFDAIAARERPLFDALRGLLAGGVAVTVVLGNHDVELSLPAVRGRLAALLGAESRPGYRFVYDGEAYLVGDVLIEHGNRYDSWNVVDFDRLRRFRSECSRRLDISSHARFFPPAGSELVERVMNPIKQDYPFIDLLKPETDAAIPLLLTLEPDFASIANSIEIARLQRAASGHGLVAPARPAQPGDIAGGAPAEAALGSLHTVLTRRLIGDDQTELVKLIDEAQRQELASREEIAGGSASRALSFLRIKTSSSYDARLKILIGTLRALQDDKSFDRSIETGKNYQAAAEALAGKGFATIVFGHTHLAKDTKAGDARYLNTGTWADVMRMPPEIVHGAPVAALEKLALFAQAIRDKRFDEYLLFRPTFAHIRLDAHGRTVASCVHDYEPGKIQAL
jgi:UDP-2,3-diacylglucosamine pyrophosphatase LpxH